MKRGTSRQKSETDWERLNAMRDEDIDTSDIPEQGEEFFEAAELRLPKKTVCIRLDADVLAWFKAQGKVPDQNQRRAAGAQRGRRGFLMKISYHPDTDSLYIDLFEQPSAESREISEGVVLDYDAQGRLVGIDIDNASLKVELKKLTLSKLPASEKMIAA